MKGIKKTLQLLSKNSKTGAVKVSKVKDAVRPEDVERLSTVATVVSPPHPVSNLRRVVLPTRPNESAAEQSFREQYVAVQAWNQDYWSKHNAEFQRKKEEFTQRKLAEYKAHGSPRDSVPIEEMASFYKTFLNDNHQKHMQYNCHVALILVNCFCFTCSLEEAEIDVPSLLCLDVNAPNTCRAWYRKNIGLLVPALLASWAYFYREVLPSVVGKIK